MAKPRIAIAGFQHETNRFAPFPTTHADFLKADSWPGLTRGAEIRDVFAGRNIPIAGFMAAAADWELAPLVWASAEPAGLVTDDAFERIVGEIVAGIAGGLAGAGHLDGVYLDLHGAMATESLQDGEGELLRRVRAVVGPDLPVVASLDFHANVTRDMVERTSALAIFRSYPHLDMAETGARAQALLADILARGEPLRAAWRQLPFLLPLSSQATTRPPLDAIYAGLGRAPRPGVANLDLAMGFPPADIHDCGPSAVAHGTDEGGMRQSLEDLVARVLEAEARIEDPLLEARDAVGAAMSSAALGSAADRGPVVIADVQDNPGAGGTSDTTGLLRALVEAGAKKAVLALLWDPAAAAEARRVGPGGELRCALGGKYPSTGSEPFVADFAVERVSDDPVLCTGTMYEGCEARLGTMALLRVRDPGSEVRVIVSGERFQCLDLALLRHMGIEPRDQRIVAVKSTVHFLAAFAPIAAEVIFADSPGAHPCRLDRVRFRHLRPGVRLGPNGPLSG